MSLAFVLLPPGMQPLNAAGPTVSGAGSTWSQIAIEQWRSDVARFGISINYQGVGSSAGRQFYMIDQVDFAASEIPFQPDELAKLRSKGKTFQYVPSVAGGTSMMYNLRDATGQVVTNLKLDSRTAAQIFTGGIDNWSDSSISKLNPGLRLPDMPIIPVIRSDGSGTSAQFSAYFDGVEEAIWDSFAREQEIPPEPTSFWPNFPGSVAQRGSDGVANYVANDSTGVGSIGYVEAGYAVQRGRPVAAVKNAAGNFALPTARNVAIALTKATLNADQTQNLSAVYRHSDPSAYPISSYSYFITETKGFDPAKGKVLGEFLLYAACDGQQQAEVLGYSPLPPNLVEVVFNGVRRIPGAPAPPPISECNNPTIAAGSAVAATEGGGMTASAGAEVTTEGAAASGTSESGKSGKKSKVGDTPVAEATADAQGDASEAELPSARDLELAYEAVNDIEPVSATPFLIAAGVTLALVFVPLFGRRLIPRLKRKASD